MWHVHFCIHEIAVRRSKATNRIESFSNEYSLFVGALLLFVLSVAEWLSTICSSIPFNRIKAAAKITK